MENLNINQYLNKVDGNTLPASEWNACLTAVQTKVNELVGAASNGINIEKIEEGEDESHSYSMNLDYEKLSFYESGNDGEYIDSTLHSEGLVVNPSNRRSRGVAKYSTGVRIENGDYITRVDSEGFRTINGEELTEISPSYMQLSQPHNEYLDSCSNEISASTITIRNNTNNSSIEIKPEGIRINNKSGVTGQFAIGNNTFTFTNGILTNVA